jgi:3-deoxy-manno-octulosonate cytidylyltransferase (CMP-KDO synthetase)
MKYILVIPARYQSSRFPGKPLIDIDGKTMIERVYNQCVKIVDPSLIYIATEDQRIKDHCDQYNMQCIMTSDACLTGTDRVGEVSKIIDADYYINIQGDEPLFNPRDIDKLLKEVKMQDSPYEVYCGYCSIKDPKRFFSRDVPKVVFNSKQELLYMSRAGIPSNKKGNFVFGYRQVCAYGFSKRSLHLFFNEDKKTSLEEQEDIELLRFIEMGIKIKMIEMSQESIPVDREEDLERLLNKLNNAK